MAKAESGAVSKTAKTAQNLAKDLAKDLARNSRIPIGACLADIKPKIDYPLIWEYTIFVPLDRDEKELIASTLGICEHKLTASNKNAKYKSFKLNLLVRSENERLEIFAKLKAACAFVL